MSGPIIEKALADNDRAHWPLIVLPFDFKSLDPALLRSVWDLLGEYQDWITTAPQTSDPHELAPFDPKPLLVLTEDADIQEQVFFRDIPRGSVNHTNFGNPGTSFGSSSFGVISSAGTPRIVQMAIRYHF